MAGGAGDLSLKVYLHKTRFWLLVFVDVPGFRTLQMVLDTGSPVSGISEGVRNGLDSTGLLNLSGHSYRGRATFVLDEVSVDGQISPPLEVYVSSRATQVGADGVIGLDYLVRFRQVNFDVDAMIITLVR